MFENKLLLTQRFRSCEAKIVRVQSIIRRYLAARRVMRTRERVNKATYTGPPLGQKILQVLNTIQKQQALQMQVFESRMDEFQSRLEKLEGKRGVTLVSPQSPQAVPPMSQAVVSPEAVPEL